MMLADLPGIYAWAIASCLCVGGNITTHSSLLNLINEKMNQIQLTGTRKPSRVPRGAPPRARATGTKRLIINRF